MTEISALLHVSLLVSDLKQSRAFYEGLLGLVPSPERPVMSFDGVWYDVGAAQIHLICLPDPAQGVARPEHGGRDHHVALAVREWDKFRQGLDDAGLAYTLSRSGRAALFIRDPDGNALELVRCD